MPPSSPKSPRTLPKPSARDGIVYSLLAQSYSEDEVAASLRMSPEDVKSALMRVHAYKARTSHDAVDVAINAEILSVVRAGGVRKALNDALGADRVLVSSLAGVLTKSDGTPMTEPDHEMRLEAVRTLATVRKSFAPTGPAVQVNTAINNSNNQTNVIGGGRSFEARRRAAAERRGAVEVADAEVVEEETEEALEGEDMGVALDDPDAVDEGDADDGEEDDE